MKVKKFNCLLNDNPGKEIRIIFPNNQLISPHFHITEVGCVKKTFIDCGGTQRENACCALQVWVANDKEHRISTTKLAKIMKLFESFLEDEMPMTVEYGSDTISTYMVSDVYINNQNLMIVLGNKPTACLAPDKCGC